MQGKTLDFFFFCDMLLIAVCSTPLLSRGCTKQTFVNNQFPQEGVMKKNICIICSILLLLSASVSVTSAANNEGTTTSNKEVGLRIISSPSGSVSTAGALPFSGKAAGQVSSEFFVRASPAKVLNLNVPENIFVEGNLGMGDTIRHEVLFAGASLGVTTCGQAIGAAVGLKFLPPESKGQFEASLGGEHKECSGQYSVGGTPVASQQHANAWNGVARIGGSYKFTDTFAVNGGLKCTSKTTTSMAIAGNTVSMESGGCGGYAGLQVKF